MIKSPESIKLSPKDFSKNLFIISPDIMNSSDIKQNNIHCCLMKPLCQFPHIRRHHFARTILTLHRITLSDSFNQTLQCLFLVFRRDAVMQIFQEMRFTRTIITIQPNTRMMHFLIFDRTQYCIQAINNLIGKNILFNLYMNSLFIQVTY